MSSQLRKALEEVVSATAKNPNATYQELVNIAVRLATDALSVPSGDREAEHRKFFADNGMDWETCAYRNEPPLFDKACGKPAVASCREHPKSLPIRACEECARVSVAEFKEYDCAPGGEPGGEAGTPHLWAVIDCDGTVWSAPSDSRETAQMDLRDAERDGRKNERPFKVARFDLHRAPSGGEPEAWKAAWADYTMGKHLADTQREMRGWQRLVELHDAE